MISGSRKIYMLLVLLLLTAAVSELHAQRSRDIAFVGKINLKAVILLHPAMTAYDPSSQAFKVDVSKVPQQQMQQKSSKQQADIAELAATIKSLQGRIQELHRNYNRQMEELSEKFADGTELATGPAALKRQDFLIDSGRVESSYHSKLQAFSAQLSIAEEKYDRISRIAYHVGFTDPDETRRKLSSIISEIRQYTQQIATQKNVQVVLNTSLSSSIIRTRQDTVMPPDLDYGKVFSVPFPRDITNDAAAVGGYYGNITSMAGNWLSHGDKILDPFKASILDNDVFIGGVDLTAEVLASIFKAYKIDPNIGNAVIQSISVN